MTRAEELAGELRAAIDRIHQELDAISDERWYNAVTLSEGWRVGHVAHHIGEGYLLNLSWMQPAIETGQPFALDPATAVPRFDAANAACLAAHGDQTRAETMAFLKDNAARLVQTVASLSDEQLDRPMMIVMGEPRLGSQVVLAMALRHPNAHMDSIRGAP